MGRQYKTISDQNVFDIAVQMFGSLNNMDKVLRQVPDVNTVAPVNSDLVFETTTNNLALRFEANGDKFATGDQSPIAPVFRTFDDTFDETFF